MSAKVRIGTQGWSYDDWRATFYPPGKERDLLQSGSFKTVTTNYDWTLNSQSNARK